MSPRTILPLHAQDISVFAKSLRRQLAECGRVPGHLELLNMLARATGFRNFQHFRAGAEPSAAFEGLASDTEAAAAPMTAEPAREPEARETRQAAPEPGPSDAALLKKLARYFDEAGRLVRWPGKFSHTGPCLWVLWAAMPSGRDLGEPDVNRILDERHLFGDPALLRRELFDRRMLDRTPDGRVYRRIEKSPPPLALELMRRLRGSTA